MLIAMAALGLWLAIYAVRCAAQPFRPDGKLRLGRRALNAWRRTSREGSR